MTRKIIDCRAVPNDVGCTLAITGEPGELITVAAQHAATRHGARRPPELRGMLAGVPTISQLRAFVQLIEFDTDRIGEWDAIVDRWAGSWSARSDSTPRSSTRAACFPAPNWRPAVGLDRRRGSNNLQLLTPASSIEQRTRVPDRPEPDIPLWRPSLSELRPQFKEELMTTPQQPGADQKDEAN